MSKDSLKQCYFADYESNANQKHEMSLPPVRMTI